MIPPTSFTVPANASADDLLRLGQPFIEFPRFSIVQILAETDFEGNPLPFSEWLTKRLKVGQPFVISGFNTLRAWSQGTEDDNTAPGTTPSFGIERLIELSTKKNIPIRNCGTGRDLSFTLRKFADSARRSFPEFQSLYARDLPCPQEWLEQCKELLPAEVQWSGRLDLFQWLPAAARSEVMMAYVGSEGSSSGFHRCFSSTVALNLLIETEGNKPVVCVGTDFESQNEYDIFMATRGVSPHLDWHNLGPEELSQADFPLYVCNQHAGDLVVLPPATAHQIWNPSTLSTKLVWNILHPLSLEVGIEHVQPPFNRLCHPDVARTNLSLACAMLSLSREETETSTPMPLPPDLPLLSRLFRELVHDESIEGSPPATPISFVTLGQDTIATCNFCSTAIWNRHVRCTECADFDLCLLCYLNGRSCEHSQSYAWAELVPQEQCTLVLNRAREILGFQLEEPRLLDHQKTLGTAANDLIRAKNSNVQRLCHLCRIDHPEWKGRRCDKCTAFFCYRGLYRHFDSVPTDVIRHSTLWTCPKCQEICNCRCCHFPTAYERNEKPASKRRVKASDPRGRVMGFADNVFDQKRGGKRDSNGVLSAAQIVGKKRLLEPNPADVDTRVVPLRKLELPTPEPESARGRLQSTDFMTTPIHAASTLPTLLPSVKSLASPDAYLAHPHGDLSPRIPHPVNSFGGALGPGRTTPGPLTSLPPMLPRAGPPLPHLESTASSSGHSRSGSSFINTVTTATNPTTSPETDMTSEVSPSTTKRPSDLTNTVLDNTIAQLDSQIRTLKRYDEEFLALNLQDSRKMLQTQMMALERELNIKKVERGMSLMDRLRREGFDSLAEVVGREVGLGNNGIG